MVEDYELCSGESSSNAGWFLFVETGIATSKLLLNQSFWEYLPKVFFTVEKPRMQRW
jgi:hypothetical protein